MRWTLLAACAAIAATLWLPGEAAEPAASAAAPVKDAADTISFEQYRDWRLAFNERRRSELAVQLAAGDLPAARKARLEQVKAYYDWLAGLPDADRDRRFRERFDRIDANHDGQIEASERAAWRDKRQAFYRRDAAPRRSAEAPAR
ncbi:MAG TPA: hypothetical protein VGQ90_05245 [Stellaceae bacterium]|jgi:hypothetical protein|nr:hypothetical protein [Stellaceae bacterium]